MSSNSQLWGPVVYLRVSHPIEGSSTFQRIGRQWENQQNRLSNNIKGKCWKVIQLYRSTYSLLCWVRICVKLQSCIRGVVQVNVQTGCGMEINLMILDKIVVVQVDVQSATGGWQQRSVFRQPSNIGGDEIFL